MRLATLIVSLILMVILGVQSCTIYLAGSVGSSLAKATASGSATTMQGYAGGGALGMVVALTWLLGAAFVMAKPTVSAVLFGLGALLAVLGTSSGFSDLGIWAAVSAVFAVMSWFGRRELRSKKLAPPLA